jgi:hypothetical protein
LSIAAYIARLGEARLVGLVVAVAAVAVHVDDDVLREALAVLDREARDVDDGLRILAVHVEHGHRIMRVMSVQ